MNGCYYRPEDVREHLLGLAPQRPEAMMMGPAGRCIPGNLMSADGEGRVTFAPQSRLMAPPPGLTVRMDVQRTQATWAFYTDTFGSDEDGHWVLERPRVLRRQEERRLHARIGLAEEDGLRLVVPGSEPCPIVDLSKGGLAFRCDLLSPWARMRMPFMAHLEDAGLGTVPVRVEIRHLRLDPAGNQTRLAGARIWCLDEPGERWWDGLMIELTAAQSEV